MLIIDSPGGFLMAKKVAVSYRDLPVDTVIVCPKCGARNMRTDNLCRSCEIDLTEAKKAIAATIKVSEPDLEHRRIAVVPKATVSKVGYFSGGLTDYAILLTDRYSIFVQERKGSDFGWFFGGVIGGRIAYAIAEKKDFDYQRVDVNDLIRGPNNVTIPHSAIRDIEIKKKINGHFRMTIKYEIETKQKGKISATLTPPDAHMRSARREGADKRALIEDYARKVKEAYEQALPPSIAQHARWEL